MFTGTAQLPGNSVFIIGASQASGYQVLALASPSLASKNWLVVNGLNDNASEKAFTDMNGHEPVPGSVRKLA